MKPLCGVIVLTSLVLALGCAEPEADKKETKKKEEIRPSAQTTPDSMDEGKGKEKNKKDGIEYADLRVGDGDAGVG